MVATAARRVKSNHKTTPYSNPNKTTTLKDNPIPIKVPSNINEIPLNNNDVPILKQDIEMEDLNKRNDEENNENNKTTEKLEEIDVSVLAQPSIKKIKKNAKEQKLDEMKEDIINTNKKENKLNKDFKLPSTQLKENKDNEESKTSNSQKNKEEKHITMISDQQRYNIITDLNTLSPNINFAQLLDLSPKLRAQLTKALKLKNLEKGDMEKIVLSMISKDDIATCECIVNGKKGSAFLDTCASINIVTKNFLDTLENVKPFGIILFK